MFAVTILGNNSAIPAFNRHPTAQVVTLNDQLFLIDCGEGTQSQMAYYKIKRSKINHIFISHLHGDHYFGLIGLLTSMGLMNREKEIHLYAPSALQEIINLHLKVANTQLPYPLHFHALGNDGLIVDEPKFTVETFHTQHRIECWGFIIREKKHPRKINKINADKNEVPITAYESLKAGSDFVKSNGEVVKNDKVTTANTPALSYAFCGDTIYDETIAEKVKGVNLLYHETTYLKDLTERAAFRFHCTTHQAASIAAKANVDKLLIGHFSSKYESLDEFLNESKEVFDNTELAVEGVTFLL